MSPLILKKKKYLIMLLCLLVLAGVTAGIYLFANPIQRSSSTYTVDKYGDVVNWCDANTEGNQLSIDCKALLLDIRNTEDGSSCFDVQVITKDKELKDLSVCEKGDTLSYTNDVLGYKKLMPVDMVFEYAKGSILNHYSFSKVSLDKVDDTYMEDIVNEDIANLVVIDPSSTTILNSVDFCPRPETLPGYVIKRDEYKRYWEENIAREPDYTNGYNYSLDDSTLRMLFACDSAKDLQYLEICNKNNINYSNTRIPHIDVNTKLNTNLDEPSLFMLKELSLVYDFMYLEKIPNNLVSYDLISKNVMTINSRRNMNEQVAISLYKIYSIIQIDDKTYNEDVIFLSQILSKGSTDTRGEYIKELYSIGTKTNLSLYLRCTNLNNYLLY